MNIPICFFSIFAVFQVISMRLFFICLLALSVTTANAQKQGKVYKSNYVDLIESSMQRILPGQPGTPPSTRYSFIFIWKAGRAPKGFFWFSGSDWMSCTVVKVHKTSYTPPPGNISPWGAEYEQERIGIANIHKGDTLELNPQSITKAPIYNPSLFKKGNIVIVYQVKNKWLYTRVKAIKKQPDLALP